MLTNNKKSCFVRSIAMVMAVLMVLAVCLTGCADKTARQDAADAKTEATAAKTTAEQISAALADYLKITDAVTKAEIEEMIDAALADIDTTKFVEVDKLATLIDALGVYAKTADIAGIIATELASKDYITATKVAELLTNYYTKSEIDAKFAAYFGTLPAGEVLAALTEMVKTEGIMSLDEWDAATDEVLNTIENLQTLYVKLYDNQEHYLNADKALMNQIMEATIWENNQLRDKEVVVKLLEYQILRAANMEDIEELKQNVADAVAIKTYEDKKVDLLARLQALGQKLTVYEAANLETPVTVGTPAVQLEDQQVVTYADKAAFTQLNEDYDDLILAYIVEGNTIEGLTSANVYDVWKKPIKNAQNVITGYEYQLTTTHYKDSPFAPAQNPTPLNDWTYDHSTVNVAAAKTFSIATAASNMKYDATANTYVASDDRKVYWFNVVVENAVVAGQSAYTTLGDVVYLGKWTADNTQTDAQKVTALFDATYTAVFYQLMDCQNLVNVANDAFDAFLNDPIVVRYNAQNNVTKALADLSDDALYNTFIDERNRDVLEDSTPNFMVHVVDPMTDAYDRNDESYVGIKRADLYTRMLAKVYELLYPKYQKKASEALDAMLASYISLLDNSNLALIGTDTGAADDFVKAFVTGELTGNVDEDDEDESGYFNADAVWGLGEDKIVYNALFNYYANNKAAKVADVTALTAPVTMADVEVDIASVLAANNVNIRIQLSAATVGPRIALTTVPSTSNGAHLSPKDAFDAELEAARKNLDEVINRYILNEVKDAYVNKAYTLAATEAAFFTKDTANLDAVVLAAALRAYVAGTADDYTPVYKLGANGLPTTEVTGYTTDKVNDLYSILTNETMLTMLAGITVDPLHQMNSTDRDIAKVGTEALAQVKAVYEEIAADMQNVSIKYNMKSYLNDAKASLLNVYTLYGVAISDLAVNAPQYITVYNNLFQKYNESLNKLTIIEFNNDLNGIALDDYTDTLVTVMNIITNNTSTILDSALVERFLPKAEGKTAFETLQANVKSIGRDAATGYTLIQPKIQATGATPFAGSAVVAMDKVANAGVKVNKINAEGSENLY